MPIDPAMQFELAQAWFPAFQDALALTPTHPLRHTSIEGAEEAVFESYRAQAENDTGLGTSYNAIAEDVIAILWGVAALVSTQENRSE